MNRTRRILRAVPGLLTLTGVLVGAPIVLVLWAGVPLPHHIDGIAALLRWIDTPMTGASVREVGAFLFWLVWLGFVYLTLAGLLSAVGRIRIPVPRLAVPMRTAIATALGAGATVVTSAAAYAAPPAHVATVVAVPAEREITIVVAQHRYTYVVRRHDTLSKIAGQWLGNPDRWPEICQLNEHRHFPNVGGTLHDCDLIYPGWDLKLPADAHPPVTAGHSAAPVPTHPHTIEPSPAPVTNATGTAAAPRTPVAKAVTHATPTTPASTAEATAAGTHVDGTGIGLPDGSWLPWALAAAISVAVGLTWLQRRRRFVPATPHAAVAELPPTVATVRRVASRRPQQGTTTNTEQAIPVSMPPGGAGLVGDGAASAARAALVGALASGGPYDRAHRGEVVIDAVTFTALIGAPTTAFDSWPRLHIVDDIAAGLDLVEVMLLERSRLLDEQTTGGPNASISRDRNDERMPPVLLICGDPPPQIRNRLTFAIGLAASMNMTALILGTWADGPTVTVATDGTTTTTAGPPSNLPDRIGILSEQTATQMLAVIRESHTGHPGTEPTTPTAVRTSHEVPAKTAGAEQSAALTPLPPPAATTTPRKAFLRVLGPVSIDDVTRAGRPLRAKAGELAALLACHPDGMGTRDIGEYLEPDAKVDESDQRVHTNVSNLRHVFGRATGPLQKGYIIQPAGRYQLDPTVIDVDLWQMHRALRDATIASGTRRRDLLQTACDLYTAPLAAGRDYEWVEPHREAARRWATEAHLRLAEELLTTDPQAASDLLDKAIGLDRYNEELYRRAMHARFALNDAAGIQILLQALTDMLADLDAAPGADTAALVVDLYQRLADREP